MLLFIRSAERGSTTRLLTAEWNHAVIFFIIFHSFYCQSNQPYSPTPGPTRAVKRAGEVSLWCNFSCHCYSWTSNFDARHNEPLNFHQSKIRHCLHSIERSSMTMADARKKIDESRHKNPAFSVRSGKSAENTNNAANRTLYILLFLSVSPFATHFSVHSHHSSFSKSIFAISCCNGSMDIK